MISVMLMLVGIFSYSTLLMKMTSCFEHSSQVWHYVNAALTSFLNRCLKYPYLIIVLCLKYSFTNEPNWLVARDGDLVCFTWL